MKPYCPHQMRNPTLNLLCTNSARKANCLHVKLEGLFHWCAVFLCHIPISSVCFPLYRADEKCLIVWPGTVRRRKQHPQGVISITFWTNALLTTRSNHRPPGFAVEVPHPSCEARLYFSYVITKDVLLLKGIDDWSISPQLKNYKTEGQQIRPNYYCCPSYLNLHCTYTWAWKLLVIRRWLLMPRILIKMGSFRCHALYSATWFDP